MRIFLYILCGVVMASSVMAQTASTKARVDRDKCESLMYVAERKEMDWVYTACGFDDETDAWHNWAPFLTKNNYRKGMYMLCKKYPTHEYSALYCKKAADAGYVPAVYESAQDDRRAGNYRSYIEKLQKIADNNSLYGKMVLKTAEEETALKAYQELGFAYLKGAMVERNFNKAYEYLKTAADLGSVEAAHAVAVTLYWGGNDEQKALADKYWWKAMMQGCPAAEETYGILGQYLKQQMPTQTAKERMEEKMYSCTASVQKTGIQLKSTQSCDCPAVLAWNKSQSDKPYIIFSISGTQAVLQDKRGNKETVAPMQTTSAGYYVREVRPSAVIVTKGAERHVLLKRPDSDCIDICQNPNLGQTRFASSVYQLQFTPEECQKMAANVDMLDNPSVRFKGLYECRMKDWKTWGQWALDHKQNKLLYVLENYQKSDYIPAQMAEIERYYDSDRPGDDILVKNLFTYISTQKPTDMLSYWKKEQAYCVRTYSYMTGEAKDDALAFSWAKAGADLGYPQSMNMLGILYATGRGVDKNVKEAASWFLKAEEMTPYPFVDARYNYKVLQSGQNFDTFRFGQCRDIVEPAVPSPDEVFNLYQ